MTEIDIPSAADPVEPLAPEWTENDEGGWHEATLIDDAMTGRIVLLNGHAMKFKQGLIEYADRLEGLMENRRGITRFNCIPWSSILTVEIETRVDDHMPDDDEDEITMPDPADLDAVLNPGDDEIDAKAAAELADGKEYPVNDLASRVSGGTPVPQTEVPPSPAQTAWAAAAARKAKKA